MTMEGRPRRAGADERTSLFVGNERPLAGAALAEIGLHVQAFVHDGDAAGARSGPDASIVRRLPSSAEPDPKPEACSP